MNISEAQICAVYHVIYAWLDPFPFLKSMTSPQASKKTPLPNQLSNFPKVVLSCAFPIPKLPKPLGFQEFWTHPLAASTAEILGEARWLSQLLRHAEGLTASGPMADAKNA